MPHGWQLVYIVVAAAVAGSSSRAAHAASLSSGWRLIVHAAPGDDHGELAEFGSTTTNIVYSQTLPMRGPQRPAHEA
jgi:hypothetical protein